MKLSGQDTIVRYLVEILPSGKVLVSEFSRETGKILRNKDGEPKTYIKGDLVAAQRYIGSSIKLTKVKANG
jgi:hypothetical protein